MGYNVEKVDINMEKLEPSAETISHYSYLIWEANKQQQNRLLVSNKPEYSFNPSGYTEAATRVVL